MAFHPRKSTITRTRKGSKRPAAAKKSPAHQRILAAFSEQVKARRKSLGMNQDDLAAAAGTNGQTIYLIEARKNMPSLALAAAIAVTLRISLDTCLKF